MQDKSGPHLAAQAEPPHSISAEENIGEKKSEKKTHVLGSEE